ncbi:hypothetical protein [Pyrodictium abyssi]|uniref:Uncharacterized protein n=1 Tax=Pyrodictium abyssi TaxID=54256 RepID=A0ABM8IZ17_9CREN|nr:hypothetical protein PABY_23600 [Pyrodictium abyssi]
MEWVHVSDLVDGRHVDHDFIPRMLAYIEAKTVYETLSKVLGLLYKAKERGLVDQKLVDTVADWLSEVEHEYRFYADQVDPWYRGVRETVERLTEKQQAESKGAESA